MTAFLVDQQLPKALATYLTEHGHDARHIKDYDGDSVIDHVAAVTGRTASGVPRISQKTTNRYNMLLTTWREINAESTGPDPIWYGLRNYQR